MRWKNEKSLAQVDGNINHDGNNFGHIVSFYLFSFVFYFFGIVMQDNDSSFQHLQALPNIRAHQKKIEAVKKVLDSLFH